MTNQSQTKETKTTTFQRTSYLLGMLFFGFVTYFTLTGDLQNHIHFAGIGNEIGFATMGMLLTVIFFYLTVAE
jgi:hypothetical protein